MKRLLHLFTCVAMLAACADASSGPAVPGVPAASSLPNQAQGHAAAAQVAPRDSRPRGRTYEEWAGRLLQWVASIPSSATPFVDATGAFTQQAQSGNVWFLMGPSELLSQPQSASIQVPAGTAIVMSALGLFVAGPSGILGDGLDTPAETQALAELAAGTWITGVQVEIDGEPVPDIDRYQVVSPTVPLNPPSNNLWNDLFAEPNPFTFGNYGGYLVFIEPLPPGVHRLHAVSAVPTFGLAFDMTYSITVLSHQP